jgi:uncharacterized protein
MRLIGIVLASVVNLFVGSSALQFALSCIGVVVFTGLTAWDTQRLKTMFVEHRGEAGAGNMAIMGALSSIWTSSTGSSRCCSWSACGATDRLNPA